MNKAILIGGVVVAALAIYMLSRKSTAAAISATGANPINSLPARAYALNNNFNPQGQPPPATFAPFSGVPFLEGLLTGGGNSAGSAPNQGAPSSNAPNAWDEIWGTPMANPSGGTGDGGSGTDVGWG
jgi:hypothetical protein